jgi:hypothetical protein
MRPHKISAAAPLRARQPQDCFSAVGEMLGSSKESDSTFGELRGNERLQLVIAALSGRHSDTCIEKLRHYLARKEEDMEKLKSKILLSVADILRRCIGWIRYYLSKNYWSLMVRI